MKNIKKGKVIIIDKFDRQYRETKLTIGIVFADNKFIGSNFISPKTRSSLLKKIYVSKIETKHTSSKTIITLYTLNTGKNLVYKNYLKLSKF